jgi:hypothetical protein
MNTVIGLVIVLAFGAFLFFKWKEAKASREENAQNPGSGGGGSDGVRPPNVDQK